MVFPTFPSLLLFFPLLLHFFLVRIPNTLLESRLNLAKLQHQVVKDFLVVNIDQSASNVAVKVLLVAFRERKVELASVDYK